ncbi:phytoene desaturase family protein [Couchioplanes azureus]|uniref:phytoene desaturase family protein n=1 Tax=Couchioplanes caeruleus TaxID=56438 RepID=UPI001670964D|nr:NAD(P)/FAD-dependent oxidoreductase [Couchioplanes caeruleus]GGQ81999.1 phytoene dehydrogenase [Couchioplanes caeruleus subsp. azureus]
MTEWDAIVIGSGLGGLTCAAYLTAAGKRTLVLEQNQVAGGCSQVFRRKGNRYEFDVGMHYIGECHPGGRMTAALRGLGLQDRVQFRRLDPDGHSTLVFPGLTFRVPSDWDTYLARLIEAFPDQRRGLRLCIGVLRRIGAELRTAALPRRTLRSLLRFARTAPTVAAVGQLPLSWLFTACRLSPLARAVIVGECGDYGTPPSRASVALHGGFLDHYLTGGAWYPRGGGQVLPAHLIDVIQTHGGRVRTKARVARILVENGAAAGVELDGGETVHAPVVVSGADLKRTYLDLVGREHLTPATVARVERYRMALPLFSVYLGLDIDLTEHLPNSTYWCYPHTDVEKVYRDAYSGRIPDEVPIFLTSATTKDPGNPHAAPPGHSTLEVMCLAPHGTFWPGGDRYRQDPGYAALKDQLTERLIDRAATVIPDLRRHIVWQEASSPPTHERFTLSTLGSCYGIEMAADQIGPRRPGPRTEIAGLWLTGASTTWGNGIVGAVSSGLGTAGAILRRPLSAEVKAGAVIADPARLSPIGPDWDPLAVSKPSSPLRRRPRVPAE